MRSQISNGVPQGAADLEFRAALGQATAGAAANAPGTAGRSEGVGDRWSRRGAVGVGHQ